MKWLVQLLASYQPVEAFVRVDAENMAEAKDKAIEQAVDADWEVIVPPHVNDISVGDCDSEAA